MKRHVTQVVFACLWMVSFLAGQTSPTNTASVSVPPVIQFSNVATDAAGVPLTGTVQMTFSLYNNSQGGEPLWTERQTVTLANSGEYSVYLGITKPNGLPETLFTNGEAHWLGVTIAGQQEQPRVFLVSVPYAMKAGDAATIGGLPPSAFVMAGATKGGVAGSAAVGEAFATPQIAGSGTQNYIPVWTDNNGDLGNSVIYQSVSQIGINTTNPATGVALDVNGAINSAQGYDLDSYTSLPFLTGLWTKGNVFLGWAGSSLPTQGSNNVAVGGAAMSAGYYASNGGYSNAALGASALARDTTGYENTAVGAQALLDNTAGNDNTAVGGRAGVSNVGANGNTKGSKNTFIGYDAGPGTSTQLSNATAIGANAIVSENNALVLGSISGQNGATSNVTVGIGTAKPAFPLDVAGIIRSSTGGFQFPDGSVQTSAALGGGGGTINGSLTIDGNLSSTGTVTGSSFQIGSNLFDYGSYSQGNAFLGFSGNTSATGSQNTAAGLNSLSAVTTGNNNVAIGFALSGDTSGNANVGVGDYTLNNVTTGAFYSAMGFYAGQILDGSSGTGLDDTAIGSGAAFSTGTLNNATALGSNAEVSESNALVLGAVTGVNGGTSVNVGIGTTAPQFTLDVEAASGSQTGPSVNFGSTTLPANFNVNGTITNNGQPLATGNTFISSTGNGLSASTSVPGDAGVVATNTANCPTNSNCASSGVVANTNDPSGSGVVGINNATSAGNYSAIGVYGQSDASGGVGVWGQGGSFGVAAEGTTYGLTAEGDFVGIEASGGSTGVEATGAIGVYGFSSTSTGSGVYGLATATGVFGSSATQSGVAGVATDSNSTGAPGVYGQSITSAVGVGVYGSGTGNGVYGTSQSGNGVYGFTNNTQGQMVAGVYGQYNGVSGTGTMMGGNAGVWADSSAQEANGALLATADNMAAGMFFNNTSDSQGYTLQATNMNSGPSFIATNGNGSGCNIDGNGDINCSGSKNAVVPIDGGAHKVALSAIESPKNWFEDFGSVQLSNGSATVAIDSQYAQTVNTGIEYHVFLTPNGDCKGLYVSQRTPASFEVRELGGGTSNIEFSYRIVALRKNYENIRLADHTHDLDGLKRFTERRAARAASVPPQPKSPAKLEIPEAPRLLPMPPKPALPKIRPAVKTAAVSPSVKQVPNP
jgi:hypothetical protein